MEYVEHNSDHCKVYEGEYTMEVYSCEEVYFHKTDE